MEFVELTREEVRELSFGCESFLQSWEMYERYKAIGKEAYFVGVKDGDGGILAAGLMQARGWHFGGKVFRVAGGWLMGYGSSGRIADNRQTSASEDAMLSLGMSNTVRSASPSSLNSTHSRQLNGVEEDTSSQMLSSVESDEGRSGQLNGVEEEGISSQTSSSVELDESHSRQLSQSEKKYSWQEVLKFITEQAKEFCRKRGGIAIEITPNIISQPRDAHNQIIEGDDNLAVREELQRLGYKYLGEYEQVKWTFVLDVKGKTPDELFKAFRTDHRQRIRRAEREGVRVRELADDELGVLKEIAAEAGERHGFQDPGVDYYETMKKAFGKKIKFVVAELPAEKLENAKNDAKNDQKSVEKTGEKAKNAEKNDHRSVSEQKYVPLAAAMFVMDKNEIIYLYSGSVRSLQKYGGAHLIQWKMIQEAIERRCSKYNFYGVYPVEGNGVYNFKLGFRGRVEELLGAFVLPIGVIGRFYAARLKYREYGELK